MSLSAGTIDRACRLGQDVRVGEERIAGAVSHHRVNGIPEQADPGFVWVEVLPDYEWRQVKLSDVTIHPTKEHIMSTEPTSIASKRRTNKEKPADPDLGTGAKLVDEEPDGQVRLEGMERLADPEIEAQAERVKDLENKRRKILAKEVEQRAILTKMMREKKVTIYPLGGDLEGYVAEIETEPKAKIHKARTPVEPDDE